MTTPIPTINQAGHLLYIKPAPPISYTEAMKAKETESTENLASSSRIEISTYKEPVNRQFWQSDTQWKMAEESQTKTHTEQLTSAKDTLDMPTSFRPGSKLLSLMNQGYSEYQSTSGKYIYTNDGTRPALTDASKLNFVGEDKKEDSFSFRLTLSSGAKIDFSLIHQTGFGREDADGVLAQIDQWKTDLSVTGEPLTASDKATLEKLYKAVDDASSSYLKSGRFDLSALELEDLKGVEELAFEVKGGINNLGDRLSLTYRNTESERTLDINLKGDKLALSLEKSGWALVSGDSNVSAEQGINSLEGYIQLIRDSSERGSANHEQITLMLDALRVLHSDNPFFTTGSKGTYAKDTETMSSIPNPTLSYAANGLKSLTGLADFSFSFDAKIEKPNMASERSKEKTSFHLDFAQETRGESNKKGDLALEQTQSYSMRASYYKPLPGLKVVDFETQNYRYIETQASATKVTRLNYKDSQLQEATQEHQNAWSERERTYVLGSLKKDTPDGDNNIDLVDFTEQAKSNAHQMSLMYVDELMPVLEPWKK
ncbi:MAG: hypothetical protein VB954_00765 [Thalassolituus sp.]|jgi:hypothetical protein|uniref:hypothetical protein n=1 Tax=Thalassolituus TaxID=187492 RepID=UPI0023F1C951|nr:hypothetical protein [Thalassolituus oleivorans]